MILQKSPEVVQLLYTRGKSGERERETTGQRERHFPVFDKKQSHKRSSNIYLENPLSRATISWRVSWKPLDGLFSGRFLISFSENKILRAVPRPWVWWENGFNFPLTSKLFNVRQRLHVTCNFPQSRHLLQPTQSMMREMFLKWSLNSSWTNTWRTGLKSEL